MSEESIPARIDANEIFWESEWHPAAWLTITLRPVPGSKGIRGAIEERGLRLSFDDAFHAQVAQKLEEAREQQESCESILSSGRYWAYEIAQAKARDLWAARPRIGDCLDDLEGLWQYLAIRSAIYYLRDEARCWSEAQRRLPAALLQVIDEAREIIRVREQKEAEEKHKRLAAAAYGQLAEHST